MPRDLIENWELLNARLSAIGIDARKLTIRRLIDLETILINEQMVRNPPTELEWVEMMVGLDKSKDKKRIEVWQKPKA